MDRKVVQKHLVGRCGDTPVHFIGREDFIANKRAVGRLTDAADTEALGA